MEFWQRAHSRRHHTTCFVMLSQCGELLDQMGLTQACLAGSGAVIGIVWSRSKPAWPVVDRANRVVDFGRSGNGCMWMLAVIATCGGHPMHRTPAGQATFVTSLRWNP